jgi:hypothetical protein
MYRSIGPKLELPHRLAMLARPYGQAGQPEVGLQPLVEALTLGGTTQERWWEAESYRLKGVLLLQLQTPDVYQEKRIPSRPWTWPAAARLRR